MADGGTGYRSMAYDTRGNLKTIGAQSLTYDMTEQARTISGTPSGVGSATVFYDYNAEKKRIRALANGRSTFFVYDHLGHLAYTHKETDGEPVDSVRLANGTLIAKSTQTEFTYFHTDHLGTPLRGTHRTDGSNALFEDHYTPFGLNPTNQWHGAGSTGFTQPAINARSNLHVTGFTGHPKDEVTELTYMQARHYDPALGRFLSIDPVTFLDKPYPGQFNRYAYTWNDPINANDPDGEFVNFVAKFVVDVGLEVALQVATGQEIDLGAATKDAALGMLDPTKTAKKVAALGAIGGAALVARKARKTCCFVAGTLVETEYGLRPIEEIELGDKVLARNPETGETALKSVTDLIRLNERQIWEVSLSGNNGASEFFETTDDHPWWVVNESGQGSWKDTAELSAGMIVTTADNQTMIVTKVVETDRIDATYNLTVADFETYFVGENRVLVHNCARKGASTTLTTKAGDTVTGNSTKASRTGGEARAPTNPQMQDALDNVSNPSGTHGACCEIDAMNKVLNNGGDLLGAKMGPVIDNITGATKTPCTTCREVMDHFDVD